MTSDPGLYFDDDGTPRSSRFGDIYYSLQDGLAESRAVFLRGCHLPQAWGDGGDVTVLELGFGTGLNIAALLDLWVNSGCPGHLHVFSVEAFVMTRAEAALALSHWPELAEFADALTKQWPPDRRGFHYIDLPQWKVSITIALTEVREALMAWRDQDGRQDGLRVDSIFLDGFSPALNPDMWTQDVFDGLAALSQPGTRLATFTVAGHVRRGLTSAGFTVEKCPGFGRKRERLQGVMPGVKALHPRPQRLAVIGAGIAGVCLAWQARAMGMSVEIYDPAPGSGASGNPAALVTPRLDAGDGVISKLFADAFAYATTFYRHHCPEAVLGQGVWQCAMNERDSGRFERIKDQTGFVPGDMRSFQAEDLDVARQASGLIMQSALSISPERVLNALMRDTTIVTQAVTQDALHGYDAIVLACGEAVFDDQDLTAYLRLRPVRGQIEITETRDTLDAGMAWGGYAVPIPKGMLFGATHDRDDRGHDTRSESRSSNLANLARILPQMADALNDTAMISRASVRVTTPDHLPVAGQIGPGLYILSGLGSRGFCLAPLLARMVIADIIGFGAPLGADTKKLLRADRFQRA